MEKRQRVQAIVIQDNKVLFGAGMVNEKEYRHFFIGGGVEKGETSEEAIVREVKEETGCKGTIIFKFTNEYKENHHTFLVDIGNQVVSLGYDPEPEELDKEQHLRALQKLQFIPLSEPNSFSLIDIEYFKILLKELNNRNYFPEWFEELKKMLYTVS